MKLSKIKNVYELPRYDKRKSFYGKAMVLEYEEIVALKSYNMIVGYIKDKVFYRTWEGYSSTTMFHVKSFIEHFGLSGGNKEWWNSLKVEEII